MSDIKRAYCFPNFPLFQNGLQASERIFDNCDRCALDLAGTPRLKIECANHVHQSHTLRLSARTRERHGESGISREFTALGYVALRAMGRSGA